MKRNEGIHRHDISDEAWERIKELLPGQAGKRGGVAKDNRLFINAAAWQTRTGAPWRDIPPEFGNWNSIHKRFCRWRDKGIWRTLADAAIGEPAGDIFMIDSTYIKAHADACGAIGRHKAARAVDTGKPLCNSMKIPAAEPEGGDTIMAQILVEENESLERAIRRFKRMVEREGIIRECKRREHYEKPSTIRNRKNKAMQRKLIKKVVGRRHALRERDRGSRERPGSYPPPR